MEPQPPIPAELWGLVPPAAQAAILLLVQQYERRLQALQQRVDGLVAEYGSDNYYQHPISFAAPTAEEILRTFPRNEEFIILQTAISGGWYVALDSRERRCTQRFFSSGPASGHHDPHRGHVPQIPPRQVPRVGIHPHPWAARHE
jgi:hypothetical protein